jgi:death on curing protein
MEKIIYITIERALEVYRRTIEVSGGGRSGVLNQGQLEGTLEQIQDDTWYPTFEAKLTHLVYAANRNHCFQDGNKRIAISLGAQFLLLNGYVFVSSRFISHMENISYHLAAGRISKELLAEVIAALIDGEEEDEALKLKILTAIGDEDS